MNLAPRKILRTLTFVFLIVGQSVLWQSLSFGQTFTPSKGPSFDCQVRDLKPSERTICDSEVLSWYDDAIAALYQDIREPKDGDVSDISFQVRKSQRFWLEQRNLCNDDVSCIEATQRERLAELGKLTQHDIKESHVDYYGNWRIKTEDMGGNFLLVATSKGEAFLSLQSVRKNQGVHLCQLQFKGGRIFQNSIVWPNQTSLDGERCMIILSRQSDDETLEEKLLVEQSECQPYWCGAFGYFEGLYERRATNDSN